MIGNLARRRPSAPQRYGVTLLLVAAMTFVRSLAPDYIAPFLLYIPVLLAVSLAFGWSAGTLTLGLSTAIAAWFYVQDGRLSGIESLAPGPVRRGRRRDGLDLPFPAALHHPERGHA